VEPSGFIAGFATVSPSEIVAASLPPGTSKKLPRYPLPVLRLARLAVDERAKGGGVGGLLLRSVLGLAQQLSEAVGCVGVVVDAKPEAVRFYERLGFAKLETVAGELGDRPEPLPMFLELGRIPR
jgi:GNAT superfamily N-acetyltransferase